ncbi:MAG: hypothetical protein ACLRMZ_13245 [Blautia marasmi]
MGDFAAEHKDIKQYAMVVPNAVEILSDKLPAFAPAADQGKYLDALGKDLEGQGITFLDMRGVLEKNREKNCITEQTTTGPRKLRTWRFWRPGRR